MIETRNELLSKVYRYYYKVSIWIVPIAFVGLYISLPVLDANYFQALDQDKQEEADNYENKIFAVLKSIAYITTITNVFSCTILFMTIRHAYKVAQKLNEVEEKINRELKLKTDVTLMHIIMIVG